ncbi:MAG: S9 family peptidase, partial [Burkholderiales bacterium]|nr:S9 family peptidase [Burkholderiales bacterium]
MKTTLLSLVLLGASMVVQAKEPADPNQWLEDVTGDKALSWVKAHNAVSSGLLEKEPGFGALRDQIQEILDSKARIPYVSKMGNFFYNFWRDGEHPRGLWRRTTLDEYRKPEPQWETVLDVDALAKSENENWVWKGEDCRYP